MEVTRTPEVLAGVVQVAGDLHAQLAGRHHDERLRARAAVGGLAVGGGGGLLGRRGEPLQQRHAEAEGLAHAGAGLADQVVAARARSAGSAPGSRRCARCRPRPAPARSRGGAELGERGGLRLDGRVGGERVGRGVLGSSGRRAVGSSVARGRGSVSVCSGQDDRLSPRATGSRGRLVDHRRPSGAGVGRADEALHAPGRCGSVLRVATGRAAGERAPVAGAALMAAYYPVAAVPGQPDAPRALA